MTALLAVLLIAAVVGLAVYDVLYLRDDGYGRLGGYRNPPRSHQSDFFDPSGPHRLV